MEPLKEEVYDTLIESTTRYMSVINYGVILDKSKKQVVNFIQKIVIFIIMILWAMVYTISPHLLPIFKARIDVLEK
jgi:hypothetical protein